MIDPGELLMANVEPDPELVELTDQISQRLQAGEPVVAVDYVDRYPQWAGAIRELLPTMYELVDYCRAIVATADVNNARSNPTTPTIKRP